jgi:hypothetical protein
MYYTYRQRTLRLYRTSVTLKEVMTRDIISEEIIHVKHDDHLESTSQALFHPNRIYL